MKEGEIYIAPSGKKYLAAQDTFNDEEGTQSCSLCACRFKGDDCFYAPCLTNDLHFQLIEKLKLKSENPDGLYNKYLISKVDGSPINPENIYFVLKLKDVEASNQAHIAASRKAALVYANEIESCLPQLAADLREFLNVIE